MPVSYTFDASIIVIRMEGLYDVQELKAAVLAALDDPGRPPEAVLMFDLRASTSLEHRATHEVRDMARFLAAQSTRFSRRLGMVAPTDVAYGLMRIGSIEAERRGIIAAVFRDFAEAREWLLS